MRISSGGDGRGPGDKWHLDEVFLTIKGERHYLWRAVDQDGNVLDILVQRRRNKGAAKKFFRKLLKGLTYVPRVIVTDKLKSYGAAKREILPRDPSRGGTSPASVSQQSRRELASADATAGAAYARVQVPRLCPTVPLGPRSHPATLPPTSSPILRACIPSRNGEKIPDLAGHHDHGTSCIRDERGESASLLSWYCVRANKLTMPISGLAGNLEFDTHSLRRTGSETFCLSQ